MIDPEIQHLREMAIAKLEALGEGDPEYSHEEAAIASIDEATLFIANGKFEIKGRDTVYIGNCEMVL